MVYSRLRGARKAKPQKNEEKANVAANDAFQEQGKRLFDELIAHPYFIIGTVGAVIALVVVLVFTMKYLKDVKSQETVVFNEAVKVWDAKVGDSGEFKSESEKMKKVIEKFTEPSTKLKDSFMGVVSDFYLAKANYRLNNYDQAIALFKKVQDSSKIKENIKFGAYEGEAFCYIDRGELEKAVETWTKYLDKVSSPVYKDNAMYYIAETYEKMNKKDKATEYYKKLKAEFPQSTLAAKTADKLPEEKKAEKAN